jgi:hypothetical protein
MDGIDQALPLMSAELGRQATLSKEAALRLAHQRAQCILPIGEDPLPSIPYFYRLMLAADYPRELIDLRYFDDIIDTDDLEEQRVCARETLEELLFSELWVASKAPSRVGA